MSFPASACTLVALLGALCAPSAFAAHDDWRALAARAEALAASNLFADAAAAYTLAARRCDAAHTSNSAGAAQLAFSAAQIYYFLGDYAQAEPLFAQAAAALQNCLGPHHPDAARALHALGSVQYCRGHFAQAARSFSAALAAKQAAFGPDHPETARTLNNLAVLYDAQQQHATALAFYQRALLVKERSLGTNHPSLAHELNNLAIACANLGRYDDAFPYARRALALRENFCGPLAPETAQSLTTLAELLQRQHATNEAAAALQRALAIREASFGTQHLETAHACVALARFLAATQQYDPAIALLQRALIIRSSTLGPNHSSTAEALADLSRVAAARGDWSNALALASRALHAFESATSSAGGELFARAFRADQRALCAHFLRAVSVVHAQHPADTSCVHAAFNAMELTRAREFLDQLTTAAAQWGSGLSPADRLRHAQLAARFAAAHTALSDELAKPLPQQNHERLRALELERSAALTARAALEEDFARTYPRYRALRHTAPVSLSHVQHALLASNDLLIAYWHSTNQLFACVITADAARFLPVPCDIPRLAQQLAHFQDLLESDAPFDRYRDTAHHLYQMILAPFVSHGELRSSRLLYVIPFGILSGLAFESLLASTNGTSFADADYLFERVPIAYAPSATVLDAIRAARSEGRFTDPSRQPVLLFCDPDFFAATSAVHAAITRDPARLIPLPGARREAHAIARVWLSNAWRSAVFCGTHASEDALLQLNRSRQLARFRFLHFATHAFLPGDLEGLSEPALALAPTPRSDGFLSMSEILDLSLDADLVTLSACASAWSEGRDRQENISGLARAFFFAGTPRVLASMWSIDDDATALFMRTFHTALRRGQSYSSALSSTRRAMLASPCAHPGLWSGFIILGDPRL